MLCWIMSATRNPDLLSSAAWLGLCLEDGLRRLLHGGRDATRSQGTELAKIWCFGLRGCFWGDAYAGEWSAELYSAGGELANLPEST